MESMETGEIKPLPSPASITELRAKVQARIAELAQKRMGGGDQKSGGMPKSRQEILEKRAKRKEERKQRKKALLEQKKQGTLGKVGVLESLFFYLWSFFKLKFARYVDLFIICGIGRSI
jgi:hypothetical protein